MRYRRYAAGMLMAMLAAVPAVNAQGPAVSSAKAAGVAAVAAPALPADYVIGSEDVLNVSFWDQKELSADVVVRPDGYITLSLLNDIAAAGLTPEQLRLRIEQVALSKLYKEKPEVQVTVKEARSRKVYITGSVARPNTYPLTGPLTVMQLIALSGGVQEFADTKKIRIIRDTGGRTEYLRFNYDEVVKQKNVQQNVQLRPGDTVVVP